jgi:hypothetical protein
VQTLSKPPAKTKNIILAVSNSNFQTRAKPFRASEIRLVEQPLTPGIYQIQYRGQLYTIDCRHFWNKETIKILLEIKKFA